MKPPCDAGISPTHWQKSVHPAAYQSKIEVIHEGVDTQRLAPDSSARFGLPNGKRLSVDDEVVTYVARNLEPYRGFPTMIRAVEILCKARPNCQFVIVGADSVSYGAKPKDAPNWRSKMLAEVKVDPARVHFLGRIPYDHYRRLLQISSAHVYLTYPFVLSWSMLEAMASGCVVVGSATAPVQEVIRDGVNGLLADFFDPVAVAKQVETALTNRQSMQTIRQCARESIVERYTIKRGADAYCALIDRVLQGR